MRTAESENEACRSERPAERSQRWRRWGSVDGDGGEKDDWTWDAGVEDVAFVAAVLGVDVDGNVDVVCVERGWWTGADSAGESSSDSSESTWRRTAR